MAALFYALIAPAHAANGVWTNVNGGSWTNALNWLSGTAADGLGNTADFTTLALPTDTIITLDGPRTIGNLSFDDLAPAKHQWSLNAGSGGSLTLAGGTPAVSVLSSSVTINAALSGTAGLRKSGTGRLVVTGLNGIAGITTVDAGVLAENSTALGVSSPLVVSSGALFESSGTLSLFVNASSTAIDVSGAGALRFISMTNGPSNPDLYFGPNHTGNSDWGARLATSLDLGNSQR